MNDTDQRFEERLLTELRAVVATNRAPLAAPQVQRTRSLRQPLMAGGTLVGAGVITAAFLLTGATSPAYAVSVNPDGSVTVTISSLKDAAGLQTKLKAAGVNSVVDYLPEGKACRQPRFTPSTHQGSAEQMSVMTDRTGAATFTIGVGELQADDTLVIETSMGQSFSMIHLGVAGGTVAPCEAVDAPAPPVGPGGNDSGPANNTGSDTGPGTDVHAG